MFEFSHIVSLMLFIIVGGIGMASMQDGLALVFRRLGKMIAPAIQGAPDHEQLVRSKDCYLPK